MEQKTIPKVVQDLQSYSKFQDQYTARLSDKPLSWLYLKKLCESSGGYLASITTTDELAAVIEYMKDFPVDYYAIGLSRQAGYNPQVDANWKWETGEALDSSITPWSSSGPNDRIDKLTGVRIRIDNGHINLHDKTATYKHIDGYICEFDPLYFQSVENHVTMDASYLRCAMRCLRQTECYGFHVDGAGCQLEEGVNDTDKRQYGKITYRRN